MVLKTKLRKAPRKVLSCVKFIFENRRLKAYLYTIFKFFVISWLQSREVLSEELRENRILFVLSTTVGFMWMIGLFIMFTERYIREVYSVRKRIPLNVTVNRIELAIFIVYTTYSFLTATVHIVSIQEELDHKYAEQPRLEEEKPKKFAIFYEILEVLIHLYIIVEKLTHFMHANHSVSLYLETPKPVPNLQSKSLTRTSKSDDDDANINEAFDAANTDTEHESVLGDEEDAVRMDPTRDYQLMVPESTQPNQSSRKRSAALGESDRANSLAY